MNLGSHGNSGPEQGMIYLMADLKALFEHFSVHCIAQKGSGQVMKRTYI